MKRRVRLDIRPGGVLMLALLYFFGDLCILTALLGSITVHELGHVLALRIFGARVRRIRVDVTGLCMDYHGLRLTGGGLGRVIFGKLVRKRLPAAVRGGEPCAHGV